MNKVLVIDDAIITRARLKDILVKEGHEVIGEAANGSDGVRFYERLKPDLVTLDISMPAKGGIETLREIIAMDMNAKIIIISAVGQKRLIIEALSMGARDFITKPFDANDIKEALKKI